jgi:predicted outer membrane repeat protein
VLGLPLGMHGIANLGTMALNNTIVADTPFGSDVVNTFTVTGSRNLIKDGSGGLPGTNFTGDPMLTAPVYSSLALLPKPGEAGSPFTLAPLPGSPAIDAGNNGAVSFFVDQRGAPRINNGVVDIGAVEVGIAPVTIVVTTLTDENDGSIDPALGAGTSLREALSLMLPEDVTITFAPGLAGVIALDATMESLRIIDFDFRVPSTRGDVTIVGPGADVITIDGHARALRILEIHSIDVSISGLTFARGTCIEPIVNDVGGGAILSTKSRLTVSDCAFLDNAATYGGGAIHSTGEHLGVFIVNNCTFVGNSADLGGAIVNLSEMTVTDSTFMGNSATSGGAIWARYSEDTDPDTPFNRPTVTSSTFFENSATEYGGAIYIANRQGVEGPSSLSVTGSTISNNSAGLNGGGIHVSGNLNLYGSTVYGNSTASAGPEVAGGIALVDSGFYVSYVELVTLVNNIVAGSTSGADLVVVLELDGTVTGSHNLIGDGSGGLPNTITADPLLGPLADNGGPTKTMALLPNSPAINAGLPIAEVSTDQRGIARPQGPAPDMGAYERETTDAQFTGLSFEYQTRQAVVFSYSDDGSARYTLPNYTLQNTTTGQTFAFGRDHFQWNADGTQLSLVMTNELPDGNYSLSYLLSAGTTTLDFFILAGDANRDRIVDITDLGILATNWQQSPRTFSQGNFNYTDTIVDITDLGMLATNWQQSLPAGGRSAAPAPPALAAWRSTSGTTREKNHNRLEELA